jgi:hypothetical protein
VAVLPAGSHQARDPLHELLHTAAALLTERRQRSECASQSTAHRVQLHLTLATLQKQHNNLAGTHKQTLLLLQLAVATDSPVVSV